MTEKKQLEARVSELQQANAQLLNELEIIYQEAEELLLSVDQERVVAYQELKARNRELEIRLDELNGAYDELRQAQKMLIHSERMAAMGEMALAIVHEIKNPLHVISGHLELMAKQGKNFNPGGLSDMLEALDRLKGLTQNVLRFSRRQFKDSSTVDLNGALTKLLEFMHPVMKHVNVRLALGRDIPPVESEASQVEQVLMNLLLNAQEAMEGEGEVVLMTGRGTIDEVIEAERRAGRSCVLALEEDPDAGARPSVFVEVADNGPGIPPELMPRIFQPFVTSKEEGKGTGLGLSICRTIVKNWGGNILVASSPDHGASFRMFLPIPRAET